MAYWGGQGYRAGPTFIPNIRRHMLVWRQFRKASGNWPIFSIITFVMRFVILILGAILCAAYADKHRWTRGQGSLVSIAVLLAAFIFWYLLVELNIWNFDLRRAGLGSSRDTWDVDQFP